MSKNDKTLCDWSKREIHERAEELAEILSAPKFVCPKCARCAGDKKWLCKAVLLAKK